MRLYELENCAKFVPGLPVKQGDNGPYILVGEWLQHSNNDRSWWQLHGQSIALEAGLPLVIGTDGTSRVMAGELVYRNNGLSLRPCDDSINDATAGVLVRYDATPRPALASRPFAVEVTRDIQVDNADVYQTYNNGKLALALMAVRPGTTLTVREARTLRQAGTGVSWAHPFNFAKYRSVTSDLHVIRIGDVSEQGLDAALTSKVSPVDRVCVEGWVGKKTAVINVERNTGRETLISQMAAALGLSAGVNVNAPWFKFAEVAPA